MADTSSAGPSRKVVAFIFGLAVVFVIVAIAAIARPWGDGQPAASSAAPSSPGAPLAAESEAVARNTAAAQAFVASPDPPSPAALAAFPSTGCKPAGLAAGSLLGLGVPRPARLAIPGPERTAFDAAFACLANVGGGAVVLRTQLPIDALRRTGASDNERAEVHAFAALITARKAPGIVSIRAHDFTACGEQRGKPAREVSALPPGRALAPCEYPTPRLYHQLFGEIVSELRAAAPQADLRFTAWNEPDHVTATLLGAGAAAAAPSAPIASSPPPNRSAGPGAQWAARKAGEYWRQAAAVVGPASVLGGEFSDRNLPTLLELRAQFAAGAQQTPPGWALHPYRDLTLGEATPRAADSALSSSPRMDAPAVTAGFTAEVSPAPVWLTEVTPLLSGRTGIGGDSAAQFARGTTLRAQLQSSPMRVILYLLTPPPPPASPDADGWDSAIADRQGRARPFICGLAGLAVSACPGNPSTFGG